MSLAIPRERNVQSRRFIVAYVFIKIITIIYYYFFSKNVNIYATLSINLSLMSCYPRTSYLAAAPGHWVSNLDGKNLGFVVSDTCLKPLLFCAHLLRRFYVLLLLIFPRHDQGILQEICHHMNHMSYVCTRSLCTPWDLAMEHLLRVRDSCLHCCLQDTKKFWKLSDGKVVQSHGQVFSR